MTNTKKGVKMTKHQIKLLDELISDITISRVEPILDDMYPDALAEGEGESVQEIVDYIEREYSIVAQGYESAKYIVQELDKIIQTLER